MHHGEPALLSGSEDTTMKVFAMQKDRLNALSTVYPCELLMSLETHRCGITCTSVCRKRVVSSSIDEGVLRFTSLHDGSLIHTLPVGDRVTALTTTELIGDGRFLYGTNDSQIRIFDLITFNMLLSFDHEEDRISSLLVIEPGVSLSQHIVSASVNGWVKMWSFEGELERCFHAGLSDPGRYDELTCVRVWPGEEGVLQFYTSSMNGTIKLWNVQEGEEEDVRLLKALDEGGQGQGQDGEGGGGSLRLRRCQARQERRLATPPFKQQTRRAL
jgi:WD40 repeat protein